jgi:hypothetical protein
MNPDQKLQGDVPPSAGTVQQGPEPKPQEDLMPGAGVPAHDFKTKEALMVRPYYLDVAKKEDFSQYPQVARVLAETADAPNEEEKAANFAKLEVETPEEFGIKYKGMIEDWAEEKDIGNVLGYSFRSRKIEIIGDKGVLTVDYDLNPLRTRPLYPVEG